LSCTAIRRSGRDCPELVPEDAPTSLCLHHLIEAYLYIRDRIENTDLMNSGETLINRDYRPSVVYYVIFGDRVKIGTTSELTNRLANLPYDELLAVEPGGRELERQRHNEWATAHIRGEWFHATPELLAHAYRVRQAHPDLIPELA